MRTYFWSSVTLHIKSNVENLFFMMNIMKMNQIYWKTWKKSWEKKNVNSNSNKFFNFWIREPIFFTCCYYYYYKKLKVDEERTIQTRLFVLTTDRSSLSHDAKTFWPFSWVWEHGAQPTWACMHSSSNPMSVYYL